jgi:2-polyprenyl-3-methyl-5-hydroxy-6-metoxy-1,4-benzoquinol methylase
MYGLTRELRMAWRDSTSRTRDELDDWYRSAADPWEYATRPEERDRYAAALELVDRSLGDRPPTAFEVGCGEGLFTVNLATRCESVLAVDLSAVALTKARDRCCEQENVSFAEWNVREEPSPGRFGLVVCMDVISAIHRPLAERTSVKTVADSIAPGGSLVISAPLQSELIERARWAHWLGRGAGWLIDRFASRPDLELLEVWETPWHLVALYRAERAA